MSSTTVTTRRKNRFNVLREAARLQSFDEFPMIRPEIDPQFHLSRNEVDQPFFLVCEKDNVVAQFSGKSRIEFKEGAIRYHDMVAGDYVYVPGGMPHRLLARETGEVMRYKARDPGVEATVWYCDNCGEELDRHVWTVGDEPVQAGYQRACELHNGDEQRRTCGKCGTVHAPIDLTPFRWSAIVRALAEMDET